MQRSVPDRLYKSNKRGCAEVRAQRKAGDGVNRQFVLNKKEVVRNLLHANCKKVNIPDLYIL